jgi:transposase
MTISQEKEANILRYYYVEKWRVGTISRMLNVHHSTIKRVLSSNGVKPPTVLPKPSMIEPYLPFILDTLDIYPNLTASRLFAMVKARGYPGAPDHFRHLISLYRPKRSAEAYLRLKSLPGEQVQVDWAHFGTITIGRAVRPLMGFVMVLSYSRKTFLRFYLNQRVPSFLAGYEAAFNYFGGVPRVVLSDNLKAAVQERQGNAILFNPMLLAFAKHYRFEPRPAAPYRGNEKGRVERNIRYIRDNFFAARTYTDLDDLNAQALAWCEGSASMRPWPEDRSQSVDAAFKEEQSKLLKLPDNPYPVTEQVVVSVGKTPYVRFDLNDYSVPHTHVRRQLTIVASSTVVTILDAGVAIAEHPRSYDKAKQIEDKTHIERLAAVKRAASLQRGQSLLTAAVPSCMAFLMLATERHYSPGATVRALLQLLDDYGALELEEAIKEALAKDAPHPNNVRLCLQKRRDQQAQLPKVHLHLPKDARLREQVVRPATLKKYDALHKVNNEETLS